MRKFVVVTPLGDNSEQDQFETSVFCNRVFIMLTENEDAEGHVTLGYVSKQSPLGQGVWKVQAQQNRLRPATSEEVLAALDADHFAKVPNLMRQMRFTNKDFDETTYLRACAIQADEIRAELANSEKD